MRYLLLLCLLVSSLLWSMQTSQAQATTDFNPLALLSGEAAIEHLQFSPGGTWLAAQQSDGQVQVWHTAEHTQVDLEATAVVFTADDQMIYADANGLHLPEDTWPLLDVQSLALSLDQRWLAVGRANGTLEVWDVLAAEQKMILPGYTGAPQQLSFLPNGRVLISRNIPERELRFWDTQATTPGQVLVESRTAYALSRDGFTIAYGTVDQAAIVQTLAQIMAVRGEAPLATLDKHWDQVQAITLSSDSRRAATASRDATISLWNISRSREEHILLGHVSAVNAVMFNPDNTRVVSGATDGQVMVWDAETGTRLTTLIGHTASIQAIAFSPDGLQLASADAAGRIILWGDGTPIALPQPEQPAFTTLEATTGIIGYTRRPLNAGDHPLRRDACRIPRDTMFLAIARSVDGSLLVYTGACEGAVWMTPYDVYWRAGEITAAALPLLDVPAPTPLIRIPDYEEVCTTASGNGQFADTLRPHTAYPPDALAPAVQSTLTTGIDVLICHKPVEVPIENCHTRGRGPNPGGIFSYIFTRLRVDDQVSIVRYDTGEILAQRIFRGDDPPSCPVCIARGEGRGPAPTAEDWLPWVMSVLYDNTALVLRTTVISPTLNGRILPDPGSELLQIINQGTPVNLIARDATGRWVLALLPNMNKVWLASYYLNIAVTTSLEALPISTEPATSALIPLPYR